MRAIRVQSGLLPVRPNGEVYWRARNSIPRVFGSLSPIIVSPLEIVAGEQVVCSALCGPQAIRIASQGGP